MMKGLGVLFAVLAAGQAGPAAQGDRRITNGHLALAISSRDAGAVCSLVYDGLDLVNDHDHGRQLQVAWIYNDKGEDYNPTEAGSDQDQMKPTSTSRLLEVRSDRTSITTVSRPAYWFTPGRHALNTSAVTGDTLTKTVTLGFKDDPRVVVFDARVAIAAVPTGPPVTSLRIEAPTLYSHARLSEHALFDLRTGASTAVPAPRNPRKNQMNTHVHHAADRLKVPILSAPDGRHAVAMVTPRAEGFWAYYTWDVPSDDPTNACMKVTTFFKHAAEAGQVHDYRTFLVAGTLDSVKASLRALPR